MGLDKTSGQVFSEPPTLRVALYEYLLKVAPLSVAAQMANGAEK